MLLIFTALGIPGAIKEYRDRKKEKAAKAESDKQKQEQKEAAYNAVKSKYGYDIENATEDQQKAFAKKICNLVHTDIKKSVAAINKNKAYFDQLNEKIKKAYGENYSNSDRVRYGSLTADVFENFTYESSNKQWKLVIEVCPTQDIAVYSGAHIDIANALKVKYKELVDAKILDLWTGDGDEGIISIYVG